MSKLSDQITVIKAVRSEREQGSGRVWAVDFERVHTSHES